MAKEIKLETKVKKSEKIEIITNAVVKEIKGSGMVNSLLYQDNILSFVSTKPAQQNNAPIIASKASAKIELRWARTVRAS
jgi:thioredoxin reductase